MLRLIFYKFFRILPKIRMLFYKSWNKFYFGGCGVRFGHRMCVYGKVNINIKGKIFIGDDFKFTSGDFHNPICRNIQGAFYTMSPDAYIKIGDRVGMSSTCLWAKEGITIGNDVNIGGDCLILDTDAHPQDYIKRRNSYRNSVGRSLYLENVPSAPIVIDDDVWIGARCQILKGVHIGARTIIAAGSVVVKDIPSDCISAGIPCKVIKYLV